MVETNFFKTKVFRAIGMLEDEFNRGFEEAGNPCDYIPNESLYHAIQAIRKAVGLSGTEDVGGLLDCLGVKRW